MTHIYWLEYADAPEHERQGPCGPSAVRHENGDCARAHLIDQGVPTLADRTRNWAAHWERAIGRVLVVREILP